MSCCQTNILPNESEIDQLRKELFQASYDANYYKTLHRRNMKMRERVQYEHDAEIRKLQKNHQIEIDELQKTIAKLQAKLKLRERQLFGKKSEQQANSESLGKKKSDRNRGQQRGQKAPPKRKYGHLPVIPEVQEIPEDERLCPCCSAPYVDIGSAEESDIIEIEVQAHIRRIKRKKYRRTCHCLSQPSILTAPHVSKVLSKSHIGNSIWIHYLLEKFWHGQPLHRIAQGLNSQSLSIPSGTILGGFFRLLPLLNHIYQLIVEKSLTDKHWHADETGWKVFETLDEKPNNRWFLWVFRSNSAAVFVADPSRSAAVVEAFFGGDSKGTISCDRYRAYFCFVSKSDNRFSIAYCWAHVRRDFLAVAKDWSQHEAWGMDWVKEIRHLYHLNNCRVSQPKKTPSFDECHKRLEEGISAFKKKADKQLENPKLPEPCRKALESLNRHWKGLTTFVENAEIPMDNNTAERTLRGGAVGRKNYYGSGSVKSAQLTAIMFTIIQTLLIWGINPQKWFSGFFEFMGSTWDKNFTHWLPWNISPEQKIDLAFKKHHDPPS